MLSQVYFTVIVHLCYCTLSVLDVFSLLLHCIYICSLLLLIYSALIRAGTSICTRCRSDCLPCPANQSFGRFCTVCEFTLSEYLLMIVYLFRLALIFCVVMRVFSFWTILFNISFLFVAS